jgi:Mycothiol maleylpyruvate isomerase N-terminal domain
MESAAIDVAFDPFISELRQGGFVDPVEGWSAEQVAAHVVRNNDYISEIAEHIAAGETPDYDNMLVIDDDELSSYAQQLRGLDGLADEVARSARRLARANQALDHDQAATMLPAVIRSDGEIVQDGPIPIGAFIEGNATFHLRMHLEQLRSLRQ